MYVLTTFRRTKGFGASRLQFT